MGKLVRALPDGPLVVLDNGGTPEAPKYEGVINLRLEKTRYYAGGVNYVMDFIYERWGGCTLVDAVWMLPDDVAGVNPEMGLKLYAGLRADTKMAAISPAFVGPWPHNCPQGSGSVRRVHHLDGLGWMFKTLAWRRIGGFDENFPGYGVEVDWCWRAGELGYHFGVDDTLLVKDTNGKAAMSMDEFDRKRWYGDDWRGRVHAKHPAMPQGWPAA